MLDQLLGNDPIKTYLRRVIEKKCVGNSWLFLGPKGVGKAQFAYAFAAELILHSVGESARYQLEKKIFPDIHIYRPEGKAGMYSIEAMRQFCAQVYLSPMQAPWKIFILHDVERMLPVSSNALLKTFEEPAKNSLIILVSSNSQQVLPTILSRCRKVCFQPLAPEQIYSWLQQMKGKNSIEAKHITKLAQGSFAQAMRFAEQNQDPLQAMLSDFLCNTSATRNYSEIDGLSQEIERQLEKEKKEREKALYHELIVPYSDIGAVQKEYLEKEIQGVVSMHFLERVQQILSTILLWYRDIDMLRCRGDEKFLSHKEQLEVLKQYAQQKSDVSMDIVQKAVENTQLGIERSMKVSNCLQALFLQLR